MKKFSAVRGKRVKYFISEIQVDKSQDRIAGSKARDDIEVIFKIEQMVSVPVTVMQDKRKEKHGIIQKLKMHVEVYREWKKKTDVLSSGDILFIQFPCLEHTIFLAYLLAALKKRGIKTVLLIHDLEILRIAKESNTSLKKKLRLRFEEHSCLKKAGVIVSHNTNMTSYLSNMGILKNNIVTLKIFDYLIPQFTPIKKYDKNKVIIAGNLASRKAGYVYQLPKGVKFELYGVNYTGMEDDTITFHGSYASNELPNVMEGGFGLVWDGISEKNCEGVYGEYLKINNPHKTSLYLASGFPVLIWKEAALAEFVTKNECGLLISSLEEIPNILQNLSLQEYEHLRCGAEKVGRELRKGNFTKIAIENCVKNGVTF